jgi:3D (Asp-Asp-Asp) domain-containing protein/peptidoglycan hydrolase CwlO-like protein
VRRRAAAGVAAAAAIAGAVVIPSAGLADPVGSLRAQNDALASQSRSALLELYALEAQLERARTELAATRRQADAVALRRQQVQRRAQVARTNVRAAQVALEERLRSLYERGETDPLEIVLGAASLEEVMAGIDGLQFAAARDREIVAQTRVARKRLAREAAALARETERLEGLLEAAAAEAASLERRREERFAYLAALRRERELNAAQIARLARSAEAAQEQARALVRSGRFEVDVDPVFVDAAPAPAPPPVAPVGSGSTLVVSSTGYALPGRTATGIPVGVGVAAVDPSVIPLGTRFTVPGYGQAVAADVGSAVRGAKIDLWFPTRAQALAWGRRTVTITIN